MRRILFRKFRRCRGEALEPRRVLDSTVVFSEIMYHPPGDAATSLEWIELQNQLAVDMDIADWRLTGGVDYTFPDGTIVPGRGHIVVAANPAALQAARGLGHVAGPWSGRLANGGELLQLYNNDDRLMNAVAYGDDGDWPAAPDGSGFSLSKRQRTAASHLAQNWSFSSEWGGTPGQANTVEPGTFTTETLLDEGATARALVPRDDHLGSNWTKLDFDDSTWTQGPTGIGFESKSSYADLIHFNLAEPPDGQTAIPMRDVNASVYIRVPFEITVDPSQFESVLLQMRFEDGFVAYINGVEVAHTNAPGRDGNEELLVWSSSATHINGTSNAVVKETFDINLWRDALKPGMNVLAIQGLNRRAADPDFLLLPSIIAKTHILPKPRVPLVINEIAPAGSESFFVEVANGGDRPVEIGGAVLTTSAADGGDYVLAPHSLGPGEMVAIAGNDLGFRPGDGELLLLTSTDGRELFDGQRVSDRLVGRAAIYQGDWYYPSVATPAAPNQFSWNTDVVLNEIMYHAAAHPTIHAQPPVVLRTNLLPIDSDHWVYNQSGVDLGSNWAESTYTADDGTWFVGQALLGFDRTELAVPIHTRLTPPRLTDPHVMTYYFQTEFEVPAEGLSNAYGLELQHFVDDGAIFYLNGTEVHRYNMAQEKAGGEFSVPRVVSDAGFGGPYSIPTETVMPGMNRLAAEVHAHSPTSDDIIFGASINLVQHVEPTKPGRGFAENEEEWIELYNRGDNPIDLRGWRLEDAVRFEFTEPTILDPDAYLVIAKDSATLAQKFPDITIAGDFRGSLNNHDERLRLLDHDDNLADEVHYFQGGRWPEAADGGGSSLELRDPRADNSHAEAWAASDESNKSTWIAHSFRDFSKLDVLGRPASFNEFIFGLLDAGEFLIDDITVTQHGEDTIRNLIQNGTFENDVLGQEPAKWRLIGNHSGRVVQDPTDPDNQVLHVSASGPQAHVHDHAETTFDNNVPVVDAMDYEISFRAKWLSGNSQLNNRLYYHRVPNTAILDIPAKTGTPGTTNSLRHDNIGPTFSELRHQPTTPTIAQNVTVSVQVADPDEVQVVELHWRTDSQEEDGWITTPMILERSRYRASIPQQPAGTVVQFFVQAQDRRGAESTFPADGTASRALYQVEDYVGPSTAIDRLRLVMLDIDETDLFAGVNRMSNRFVPVTLIHNDHVFYDAGVRQVGSRWVRPNSGYKVKLQPDNAFYGIHDSVRFDLNGLSEIVMKQMVNRAGGGQTSLYDDIAYLVAPLDSHSHEILLNLARYESVYLNEQFANGSDGTKWELDHITYPTQPSGSIPCPDAPNRQCNDHEGLKANTGVITSADIGVHGDMVASHGYDPEFYRGHLLLKSNRVKDDFGGIVTLNQAIHLEGDELFEATNEIMDVDLWMRHYANQAYLNNWDSYGFVQPKNLRIYRRPTDNRFIPLFWDCDLCNFTGTLIREEEQTSRLDEIRDIPHNLRLYWGHMLDYINRSFNEDYVARWAQRYGELTNNESYGGPSFDSIPELTRLRTEAALVAIQEAIPPVDFQITTTDGVQVDDDVATIRGKGWVNVRQIRFAGNQERLDVFWPETDVWEVRVPVAQGINDIVLEAFDFERQLIGTASVRVTSSAIHPVFASLRVSEIHYNPALPTALELEAGHTDKDDFEFLELMNIGEAALDLTSVQLVQVTVEGEQEGLQFDFGEGTINELSAGQRIVVVEDIDAFRSRYGQAVLIAGQWSGGLGNRRETLTVARGEQIVQQFEYDADWHSQTDGEGFSLEIHDPNRELELWSQIQGWQPSRRFGGTPGNRVHGDLDRDGRLDVGDIDALTAEIRASDAAPHFDLTGDGRVNADDLDELVRGIMNVDYGDTNLDGIVDQIDFETLAQKFGSQSLSRWTDGDSDGDGDVDFADFVRLSNSFGQS